MNETTLRDIPEPVYFLVTYWKGKERTRGPKGFSVGTIFSSLGNPPGGMPQTGQGEQSLFGSHHALLNEDGPGVLLRAMDIVEERPHPPEVYRNDQRVFWHGTYECEGCQAAMEEARREHGFKLVNGKRFAWDGKEWVRSPTEPRPRGW